MKTPFDFCQRSNLFRVLTPTGLGLFILINNFGSCEEAIPKYLINKPNVFKKPEICIDKRVFFILFDDGFFPSSFLVFLFFIGWEQGFATIYRWCWKKDELVSCRSTLNRFLWEFPHANQADSSHSLDDRKVSDETNLHLVTDQTSIQVGRVGYSLQNYRLFVSFS